MTDPDLPSGVYRGKGGWKLRKGHRLYASSGWEYQGPMDPPDGPWFRPLGYAVNHSHDLPVRPVAQPDEPAADPMAWAKVDEARDGYERTPADEPQGQWTVDDDGVRFAASDGTVWFLSMEGLHRAWAPWADAETSAEAYRALVAALSTEVPRPFFRALTVESARAWLASEMPRPVDEGAGRHIEQGRTAMRALLHELEANARPAPPPTAVQAVIDAAMAIAGERDKPPSARPPVDTRVRLIDDLVAAVYALSARTTEDGEP